MKNNRPGSNNNQFKAKFSLLILLLLLLFQTIPPVQSATWVVDTALDISDGECVTDCSLRDAILLANPGDTITFAGDMTIYLSSQLTIEKQLTIDAEGQSVVLSGDTDQNGSGDVRVFSISTSGELILSDLQITKGYHNDKGGGIYNQGILETQNCLFTENSSGYRGGGIYTNSNGNTSINESTFINNSADGGGAVYCFSDSITIIIDSTIEQNQATSQYGGGVFNFSHDLTIINTLISENTANSDGGGLYNNGTATVQNSTFYRNSATGMGGGIYTGMDDHLTLTQSTLAENNASLGGGIANRERGVLNMTNTLIANSSDGMDCANQGTIPTNNNNLVMDGECSPMISGNPRIGALDNYGGPTKTLPLLPGSPAIDSGSKLDCLPTDQRGISRFQVNSCDIGAFESQGFYMTDADGDFQSTEVTTNFPASLRVKLIAVNPLEPVGPLGLITYTAPTSGPSLNCNDLTFATSSAGIAAPTVTANDIAGSYQVVASTRGSVQDAFFYLTNTAVLNLTLTKTVSMDQPNAAKPGDALTYTLLLENPGAYDASGVHLEDLLPAGVSGTDLDWTGDIDAGETLTFTIDGVITDEPGFGDTITNTAYFTFQSESGSDTASFIMEPQTDLNLNLTKTVSMDHPDAAQPGDALTYTLTLENPSAYPASGVHLTDILPTGVTGTDLDWTGDIGAGETITFIINGTVSSQAGFGDTITNTASFTYQNESGSDAASFTMRPIFLIHMPVIFYEAH